MTFSPATLEEQLATLQGVAGQASRYVVAFSGGVDSTVLLHALHKLTNDVEDPPAIIALHVDHGLHDESAEWSRHCESSAAGIGVNCVTLRASVALDSGKGQEAAARDARYTALAAELQHGDWLLSAHHREDQAETLLLNLIRGSGPAGIAGISDIRRFGQAWLARPMLSVDRESIRQYAIDEGLSWIDDPSNTDRRFDRNFLRHEVLPRLQSRWPDIAARLQRSANHAREAAQLLAELAQRDLEAFGERPQRLPIDRLAELSPPRQRNLLRHAIRELGLAMPTTAHLERVLIELIPARADAQPLVSWPGASLRRYRNGLYIMPEHLHAPLQAVAISGSTQDLGPGLGWLQFEAAAGVGLRPALVDAGLRLQPRRGGEEFLPEGHTHTRKLKKLLQEAGIVPWMRDRLPLIYSGDRLVAVGDLWLAADAVARPGTAIRWHGRPALH